MPKLIEVAHRYFDPISANLSVVEFTNLPWEPKRIYWIRDFADGASRGNHAHKKLSQIFIVISGSIEMVIYRGLEEFKFNLEADGLALQLSPGAWRVISNATPNTVVLVLADAPFDETDYIRSWSNYLEWFKSEYDFK